MTKKAWFPLSFPTFYFNEEQEVVVPTPVPGAKVNYVQGKVFKLNKVVNKKCYINK